MQDDSSSPNADTRANAADEYSEYSDANVQRQERLSASNRNASANRGSSLERDRLTNAGSLPSDPHWTSRITTNDRCLSCEAPRAGEYCANCGQKFLHERLGLWELIKALFARVTDLESGLLHTVIAMFRRPGTVCREYAMGKQKVYSNPLTYYFLGAAAQILAYWVLSDRLREGIVKQFDQQAAAFPNDGKLEELLGKPISEAYADSYFSAVMQGYAYVGLFAFVFPFALVLWFLHGALGERFRLGETFVFALFTFSQMLFITAVLGLFTFPMGISVHTAMAFVVYGIFPQYAHTKFFESTWPSRAMTFVSTVMAWFCFIAGIMLVFLVTFGVQIVMAVRAAN